MRLDSSAGNVVISASTSGITGKSNRFAVTGGTATFGKLVGSVTYADRCPPGPAATVHLTNGTDLNLDAEANVGAFSFRFPSVPCGTYAIWASYAGGETDRVPVVIECGSTVTKTITIPPPDCDPTGVTPVLLVPGILGSSIIARRLDVYPTLPAYEPEWNGPDWPSWCDGHGGLLDPGVDYVGWEALVAELRMREPRYQVGCNLFPVPYDWRISVGQIADDYLLPWIEHVKGKTGATQVDVVAHSTGGLACRSYIQKYGPDSIRKLAMVGTPNQGSAKGYVMWEGGDPQLADRLTGDRTDRFLFRFYQRTTEKLFRTYYGITPTPDRSQIYNLYRYHVPLLRDLLPTNEFLLETDVPARALVCEPNDNLMALNASETGLDSEAGVFRRIFSGTGQISAEWLEVAQPDCSIPFYGDGEFEAPVLTSFGDGTVLEKDTRIPGVQIPVESKPSGHAKLISAHSTSIASFITGQPLHSMGADAVQAVRQDAANVLTIGIQGRAQGEVVDTQGQGSGINPTTGDLENAIPGSVVLFGGTWGIVEITNAAGEYAIGLTEPRDEDYWLDVQFADGETVESYEFAGFIHSKESRFSITVTPDSVPRVRINRTPERPIGLLARPAGFTPFITRLSWHASADPAVVKYNVYSRGEDEPSFTLIGTTSEPFFDTPDLWAADTSNLMRIYVVAAVNGVGDESFLSEPVVNLPVERLEISSPPRRSEPKALDPRP
ncbi:MAG: alpha/beta fold hydrolase [Thermoanaerobaculia bacterium]